MDVREINWGLLGVSLLVTILLLVSYFTGYIYIGAPVVIGGLILYIKIKNPNIPPEA